MKNQNVLLSFRIFVFIACIILISAVFCMFGGAEDVQPEKASVSASVDFLGGDATVKLRNGFSDMDSKLNVSQYRPTAHQIYELVDTYLPTTGSTRIIKEVYTDRITIGQRGVYQSDDGIKLVSGDRINCSGLTYILLPSVIEKSDIVESGVAFNTINGSYIEILKGCKTHEIKGEVLDDNFGEVLTVNGIQYRIGLGFSYREQILYFLYTADENSAGVALLESDNYWDTAEYEFNSGCDPESLQGSYIYPVVSQRFCDGVMYNAYVIAGMELSRDNPDDCCGLITYTQTLSKDALPYNKDIGKFTLGQFHNDAQEFRFSGADSETQENGDVAITVNMEIDSFSPFVLIYIIPYNAKQDISSTLTLRSVHNLPNERTTLNGILLFVICTAVICGATAGYLLYLKKKRLAVK